jgi:polyhydroxyalkanoate synthesis regulator phasin
MSPRVIVIAIVMAALPAAGYAQSSSRIDERQANQQKRIDSGVKSGELTEQEAKRLQKGQQRVQKMEDKARADGRLTAEERQRIERAQDRESKRIHSETHDKQHAKKAPPPSHIDQRQAEQQRRIDEGVKSGQLTKKEAERLQKGQAHIQKMEDKAMADGRITPEERRRIEAAQDRESERIRRERHDRQTAKK